MRTHEAATILHGWRLALARAGYWLLVGGALVYMFILVGKNLRLSLYTDSAIRAYPLVEQWVTYRIFEAYVVSLRYLGLLVFIACALLIYWRRSNDWLALLTSLVLVLLPTGIGFGGTLDIWLEPPVLRNFVNGLDDFFATTAGFGLLILSYVFPDGRFVPARLAWLWIAILGLLFISSIFLFLAYDNEISWIIFIFPAILNFFGGPGSQVYRYFKLSAPVQRQQTRWAVVGLLSLPMYVLILTISGIAVLKDEGVAWAHLLDLHLQLIFATLLPACLAIAVLRYRLWDIDLIVRRTLLYSALTAILAGVYYGSVLALQSVVTRLGGGQSTAVTVISTLGIASLFNPLRRRLQDFIDRSFYRQKYNAELALASFAASARNETDLPALTAKLLDVVNDTMQPEHIDLWLKRSTS